MTSDEQLIKNFQQSRDPADWEELVNRHFDKVHGLAFKMTSSRELADDISQDVFLKVVSALESFEGKSQFATWLYRIAMNTIYTQLKKENRSAENLGDASPFVVVDSTTPDRNAIRTEMVTEIESEIQKLKPEFRAAIVLTAFQNLSPGEAATIEGCTPQTFYWRLNQARNQLKKQLRGYLQP